MPSPEIWFVTTLFNEDGRRSTPRTTFYDYGSAERYAQGCAASRAPVVSRLRLIPGFKYLADLSDHALAHYLDHYGWDGTYEESGSCHKYGTAERNVLAHVFYDNARMRKHVFIREDLPLRPVYLGENQKNALRLLRERGSWYWYSTWRVISRTKMENILISLVKKGLVRRKKKNDNWVYYPVTFPYP